VCHQKLADFLVGRQVLWSYLATELKSLENRTDQCEEIVVDNTTEKESWADIVAKVDEEVEQMIKVAQDVESKMKGVTIEMTILQKQTNDLQSDRE